MGRYIGPKFKHSRREGEKLDERGVRASGPKSPMVKRNYPPGQHGPERQKRSSEYGMRLRTKQKAKRIYGVFERQFRNYYKNAIRRRENSGELIFQQLERRLDNIVFRLGYATTRRAARQLVTHKKITVNGKVVNVPSFQVRVHDDIGVTDKAKKTVYFQDLVKTIEKYDAPEWLSLKKKEMVGMVMHLPTSELMPHTLDLQSIIEFYSR